MNSQSDDPKDLHLSDNLSRRQFLKKTLAAAGAVGALGAMRGAANVPTEIKDEPKRMEYRRLGRTNLKISAVVAGEMHAPMLHERAFELGVNYWHKMGDTIALPELFGKKDRDSFYCDMVIDTLDKDGAIAQFEWGLKNSGLEMIDFIKVHSLYRNAEEVRQGEGIFRAFEQLKKQGKTRFLSAAQHGNTAEVLTACIESGHFDAIQPNFNVLSQEKMYTMIALAKKHDVGVICKKVMLGGARSWERRSGLKERVEKYLDSETTLGQALIKHVLAVPGVAAVVPFVKNLEQLEEDMAAGFVAKETTMGSLPNQQALSIFAEGLDDDYCRSCGQCVSACSRRIAVPDILRYTMYYVGYAEPDRARQLYQGLPSAQAADQCNNCGDCELACPHGLPVRKKLQEAHALLA